ncbi:hypothetical protein ACO0RG_003192 [Hanseniaspora osmophila]
MDPDHSSTLSKNSRTAGLNSPPSSPSKSSKSLQSVDTGASPITVAEVATMLEHPVKGEIGPTTETTTTTTETAPEGAENGVEEETVTVTTIEAPNEVKTITKTETPYEIKTETKTETPTETIVETAVETKLDKNDLPIQLISEEKQYNSSTLEFFKKTIQNKADIDKVNYHVISVFGSQSSGKSTLLNNLFHTNFDTMDAQVKRQQTTKGIWLGHAKEVATTASEHMKPDRDLFVLDVEGSDGAERGEDQEFERKAALFALAVSEVLIINMWEHQVGLYQGNNMELLKTVFEVNLSLFGKSKMEGHKVLLLFVIRDHIGVTPIESLKASLLNELEKMWEGLSKPQGTESTTIFDFFDFEFKGIGHKYLQYDQFVADVKTLGDSFTTKNPAESYFKPEYHHNLPLDGWNLYSESCWMTIENSVELDLPTQQILVAKFKTKEFSDAAFEKFKNEFEGYNHTDLTHEDIAKHLSSLKMSCFLAYDEFASRYNKQVYQDERQVLSENVHHILVDFVMQKAEELEHELLVAFKELLNSSKKTKSFVNRSQSAKSNVAEKFEAMLSVFFKYELIDETDSADIAKKFNEVLIKETETERGKEFDQLVRRFERSMKLKLQESLELMLMEPKVTFWKDYNDKFHQLFNELLGKKFKSADRDTVDFKLGFSTEENEAKFVAFKKQSWKIWKEVIDSQLTISKLPSILEETFKINFLYENNDSPRFFTNVAQIDEFGKEAKDFSLQMLDIYSVARLSDESSEKIKPDVSLFSDDIEREESEQQEEEETENDFAIKRDFGDILTDNEKEKVRIEFNKKVQLVILQTKRSILTSNTKIPPYMFLLLGVLGFNEFMMILRHPLLLTLCILTLTGWYFVHRTGSYRAVQHVAASSLQGMKDATVEKLRDALTTEQSSSTKSQRESFEMQEMSSKKQD